MAQTRRGQHQPSDTGEAGNWAGFGLNWLDGDGREIAGEVLSVDHDAETFAVRVSDQRPGRGGATVTIEVDPDTAFVAGDGVRVLTFGDLRVGSEVSVRGRGASREKLRATLVEITLD